MAKIEDPEEFMRIRAELDPWCEEPAPTGAEDLPDETGTPPNRGSLGKTGDWRVSRPVMPEDIEQCSRCCMCWMMCPEGAISLDEDDTPYIDYEYCKGCLICVEVCPKKCIQESRESESSGQPPTIPTP